jgi:hypothetical protein
VNNGTASPSTFLTVPGTYTVHATFTSFGPWATSSADVQITVVPSLPPKRRAVRH